MTVGGGAPDGAIAGVSSTIEGKIGVLGVLGVAGPTVVWHES